MSNLKEFIYNNQKITFEFTEGHSMVNATEMAKPFPGKTPAAFLRTKGTKAFMLALEEDYRKEGAPREVLRIVQGGDARQLQGTWMDEHLALKFAGYLAPAFEVWVYKQIQQLLTTGKTELRGHDQNFGYVLREIASRFDDQDLKNHEFDTRITEVESQIRSKDENYYTIAGFCNLYKIDCPLDKAKAWGRAAVALSKEKGMATGEAHDERYGKVRTYHNIILMQVILGK